MARFVLAALLAALWLAVTKALQAAVVTWRHPKRGRALWAEAPLWRDLPSLPEAQLRVRWGLIQMVVCSVFLVAAPVALYLYLNQPG